MILTYTRSLTQGSQSVCNYNGGVRDCVCPLKRLSTIHWMRVCVCFSFLWWLIRSIEDYMPNRHVLISIGSSCFRVLLLCILNGKRTQCIKFWAYVHEIYYANNPEFLNGLICLLFLFAFHFSSLLFGFCSNFKILSKVCLIQWFYVSWAVCVHVMLAKLFPNRARIQAIQLHHRNAILCIEYFIVCRAVPCHAVEMNKDRERNTKQQLE